MKVVAHWLHDHGVHRLCVLRTKSVPASQYFATRDGKVIDATVYGQVTTKRWHEYRGSKA
jgi:hypothetical protein